MDPYNIPVFGGLLRAITQPKLVSPLPTSSPAPTTTKQVAQQLVASGHGWSMPGMPNTTAQAATPAPTALPVQPTQLPAANPNFRFAYESLPRDQYYATNAVVNSGGQNRPGFQPAQPPPQIAAIIRQNFPNEATAAAAVAATENGQFDPRRADNINASDGSRDRGIFQINSNSFNGLLQRRAQELSKIGVKNFDDLYDPQKNAAVAKMIKDEGGWGRWFGWQSTGYNLNNGWFSQPNRGQYAEEQKSKRKK